jgi:hypothetical protein
MEIEIDLGSFLRAGLTEMNGAPHLYLSEYRDYESADDVPESFFLVPVAPRDAAAFEQEYSRLKVQNGDSQQIARRWSMWCEFRASAVDSAAMALRAERNFAQWSAAVGEGRVAEVSDSGWIVKETLSPEYLRERLRDIASMEQRLYGTALHPEDLDRDSRQAQV